MKNTGAGSSQPALFILKTRIAMFNFRTLLPTLMIALLPLPALASQECDAAYNRAVKACNIHTARCTELNACQDLRASCNQNVSTEAGCRALDSCSGQIAKAAGTSSLSAESLGRLGQRCAYVWKGDACVNTNLPISPVGYECPGFVHTSSPKYRDPGFACSGLEAFVADGLQKCIDTALAYYNDCASDPVYRPQILFSRTCR